jgi:hypothetical protein
MTIEGALLESLLLGCYYTANVSVANMNYDTPLESYLNKKLLL